MTPKEYFISQLNSGNGNVKVNTDEVMLQQYAYKVAYITDQKCIKPEITIYSNDLVNAIKSGVHALKLARAELNNAGFVSAPLGEVVK